MHLALQEMMMMRLLLLLLLSMLLTWSYSCCQGFVVVPMAMEKRNIITVRTTFRLYSSNTDKTTIEEGSGADVSIDNKSKTRSRWNNFDWNKHWYPVSWLCDLQPNQPTKVTLFDVDYVVAVNDTAADHANAIQITALRDICPHKAAALSEGRITSSGALQCAYHGWTFDGTTGQCVQIPQSSASATSYSPRTCAQAVPAVIHQGMLWLWPGQKLLQNASAYPSPPSIPEMDNPKKFTSITRVVRDFPVVDWTLLVSNILDPDHGLFAHQMPPFDWYSASAEYPLNVTESFPDDAGWTLQTKVPAVEKLLKLDKQRRESKKSTHHKTKKFRLPFRRKAGKAEPAVTLATSTFYAPTTISLCRRPDEPNAETKFVTGFWVCPVGTGRSRFFSAAIGALPIKVPRFLFHLNLNGFLDQDTVLVASQQPAVLTAEAEGNGGRCQSGLFKYASPTDRATRLIDQFWDATVSRAPNRNATLQELYRTGQLRHTPDRRVVLDRKVQHLDICPDSQDAVRNAQRIRTVSVAAAASWVLGCLWQRTVLKHRWIPVVAAVTAWVAHNIQKGFYFCYPASNRNRDLKKIPKKMWLDPEL